MTKHSAMLVMAAMLLAVTLAVTGCYSDRPHGAGQQRPDVDSLDDRDSGLQSKDVVSATDKLVRDLLANKRLNASRDQWTMVVMDVQNKTSDRRIFNPDIFIERLRAKMAEYGEGRVQIIENRDLYHELQGRELENERDDFKQGSGGRADYKGIQPDYAMYGKLMDMPNRGTNYYQLLITVTNFKTREQVWTGFYEVRVAR